MIKNEDIETRQITVTGISVSDYEDIKREAKRTHRCMNGQMIVAFETYAFQLRSKERRRANRGRNSAPKEKTE